MMYYGWRIVIATSCTLFVCSGIGFFTFPVFLKFIEADLHVGRDSLSYAGALGALAAGFATPAIGYALDRFGARAVMIPGAVLLSTSYLLLSRSDSILHLYALFLTIGVGMAATTILPSQTLISRWFVRRRGRAMGITAVSAALGGMFWMPVSSRLIEGLGWRNAYEVLGIVVAAVSLPLISLFIRSSPQAMGLAMEGGVNGSSAAGASNGATPDEDGIGPGYTTAEALTTRGFWLIFCSSFFGPFAGSGFGLHVVAFLSDSGLSPGEASSVWSAVIGVSIGGMFLFGFLAEKCQKRYLGSAGMLSRGLSVLFLVLFPLGVVSSVAALAQLIIMYGLALGCVHVVSPLLLSETFGVKSFGKLGGLIGIPFTLGMALGQVVGGRLFVLQNNYTLAFSAFAISFVLSGVAFALVKPYFLIESGRGAPTVTAKRRRKRKWSILW
jgi:MFS family permease